MCTCASSSRTRTAVPKCTAEACGVYLDRAAKVTVHTIDLLIKVAEACQIAEKRDAMFRGEVMNPTEQRSVRHVSLRATRDDPICDRGSPGHVR